MLQTILAGQLWTVNGFVDNQQIHIVDGKIDTISPVEGRIPSAELDASDAIVIPGLIDIQVNGALGWSFQSQHRSHFDAILDYHRRHGTTTLLPTLVTADADTLRQSLQILAAYLDQSPQLYLPGIHLEGPFLSPQKSGAHDPDALCDPELNLTEQFIQAAAGRIRMVTLAPELTGALSVIRYLTEQGVLVSAGHTAATYAELQKARQAGLGCVTHAGNASDWPHRAPGEWGFMASEPGVVGTLLAVPDLPCGVILDGFHFHPALLRPLVHVKGLDYVLLVSDASTVAGCAPGHYSSGGLDVTVHEAGFATSGRGGGWLAGSTITLLDAVQRSVHLAGFSLHEAVWMATRSPARLLGIEHKYGEIRPGLAADILILNQDLSPRHVIIGGAMTT